MIADLSLVEVCALLRYEPESGKFFWKKSRTNAVKAGSETAKRTNSDGYRHIHIGVSLYKAHRLAWLISYGEWPSKQIDHINGDRGDNSLKNLRQVTNGENQQNRTSARKDNTTSGHIGVGFFRHQGQWRARIQIDGKPHFLGYFPSKDAAVAAYITAKAELHPFNRQRS